MHQVTAAKDPDAAFFKKLDGFQPCEITELKAGTHVFAVYGLFMASVSSVDLLCYLILHFFFLTIAFWLCKILLGDNFFKSVSYTIEAICAEPFMEEKDSLRAVEAQILTKRVELSKFEAEYREVRICHEKYLACM